MKMTSVFLSARLGRRVSLLRRIVLALAPLLLAGCGAWQSTKATTSDTTRAIFTTKVKTIHVSITGRGELNRDDHGIPLPVAIRIYQLKNVDVFMAADYTRVLNDPDALKREALGHFDLTLHPGQTSVVDQPVAQGAQYIGVAAFFRNPGKSAWKLAIPVSRWKKSRPVQITANGKRIEQEHESR